MNASVSLPSFHCDVLADGIVAGQVLPVGVRQVGPVDQERIHDAGHQPAAVGVQVHAVAQELLGLEVVLLQILLPQRALVHHVAAVELGVAGEVTRRTSCRPSPRAARAAR